MEHQLGSVGLRQGFDGFDRALQPTCHLEHVADLERLLTTLLSSCQPAEGGLFNALGFQPLPERGAELSVAGFKPQIPVFINLSDGDLETDLKTFTRIQQCDAGPLWGQAGVKQRPPAVE